MSKEIEAIYIPDTSTELDCLLFTASVPAGFPSPAADYEENRLDLNKHLIQNPASTFFVRVSGDSMVGAGIHSGDILIVDRSLEPRSGKVVIAVVDAELTVKRIRFKNSPKRVILESANEKYPDREISGDSEFEVWGVVTNVIHRL
ncbi:LexA repressor [Limihaloglobus sulfuriphilus]|uniref:LexA repressor n=1 Tax=Limihaloglobus sulfuriphilus TaxID=1851148 RepID=A0A1Q2MJD7_9BACT|nr:translesion error-prone DNA polymerase V autoproteolytic subunit [Limihaloglobus sulfuriphilus]AQQ72552.1 LexA repressor [Limihaloglobus sulfuriphilus]AQQ72554.1 LexA repressor [Limihaloglobus sulfuriphilus]